MAQDQLADRAATARVAVVEVLGDCRERAAADGDLQSRVGEQVERPGAVGRPRGDENRTVRLVDEADGDRPWGTGPSASDDEPGEAVIGGEVGVEKRVALGRAGDAWPGAAVSSRILRAGRQRLRCQDLPSVATDGA